MNYREDWGIYIHTLISRHLLIGVDNLRLLAASLETQPQQPVGRKPSSSDDSQDDEPGPAL